MPASPVPVTLLTGFLGSGKTTLLNRLVAAPEAGRLAVVVNETGDVALDARLVVGSTEEIVELRDGCVCCTVRGDLSAAVGRLLDRRRAWLRRLRFDRIVVECSGLASPGPVVQTFLLDPKLAAETRVDGVLTLASAADVPRQLREHPETAEQLGYADLVLLNHVDRAPGALLDEAEAAVRAVNPNAPLVRTVRGELPVARLLDLGGADPARWRLGAGPSPPRSPADGHHPAGAHAHEHEGHTHEGHTHEAHTHESLAPDPHLHTPAVTHVSLASDRPLDLGKLKLFLQFVAARRTWTLFRLKGIFRCEGHQRAVVAHGVYQWLELGPGPFDAPPRSQLLLIGRDLDADELRRGWAAVGG